MTFYQADYDTDLTHDRQPDERPCYAGDFTSVFFAVVCVALTFAAFFAQGALEQVF